MKVYVVIERGWSSGQIVLWVCREFEEALRLADLRKEFRHVEEFELQ